MDNINQILAQKRAWRDKENNFLDRRKKDGSIEDRHNLAVALKEGRRQQARLRWWETATATIMQFLGGR